MGFGPESKSTFGSNLSEVYEIAGISTDFKGTHIVIDCVAIISFSSSQEDLERAQNIVKIINDACEEACRNFRAEYQ